MDKIKGLGDLVAIVTKYTGIKWIVKKLYGNDCGCDERQEKLNILYPVKKPQSKINKVKKPVSTPPKSYEK
jgi:hypothetical protein